MIRRLIDEANGSEVGVSENGRHLSASDGSTPQDSDSNASTSGPSTRLERRLLRTLLAAVGDPPIEVRLWDGEAFGDTESPVGKLTIGDRGALMKILADANFQFGEMYAQDRLKIDGPLDVIMTELFRTIDQVQSKSSSSLWTKLLQKARPPRSTTLRASKDNIYHHYDIGNDFYQLWLDEEMAYTCAYFHHENMTLEAAQRAKFDHVCRKARLEPDMVVVEAGCGWGGLALHMAEHYGVRVRAYNISREQLAYATAQARERNLDDRVEFIEGDWRDIKDPCDAFMSVGMLEHVGRKNYRHLGAVLDRCLSKEGRGLIHTIGQNRSQPFSVWIERRIFPGAYTPTLAEMMDLFAPYDFSVLDVENLRLHYAQTLRHWLQRFDQHVDQITEIFDPQFVRMWRLYLAGSVAAFATGTYQLYQVAFNRNGVNDIPWTREHLYSCDPHEA